jgi:S-adenosyl methyltransferase
VNDPEMRESLAALDITVPNVARIYDYLLGGKDNISQVASGLPYSGETAAIQALQPDFSKTASLAVWCLPDPHMGFMSGFSGGHS